MADDNLYDSEEDEDYKPDLEKPAKPSRKNGKKEQQLELGKPGITTSVDNSEKPSIADPLAQLKSDAKKAKINALWEQLNAKDTALSSRASRGVVASSAGPPSKVAAATPGWMKNLGMVPQKPASNGSKSSTHENGAKAALSGADDVGIADTGSDEKEKAEAVRKEEARKVASAALAAAKLAAKAITDGKVQINEVRDFAGEEVRVTKFVDPNSKAAVAARRKAESVSSSGLDALLEQIGKKQKLNILDKSRKDWGEFKEETGIESELEGHIKSGDKYTDKVAFLQRADLREYEKERDARLAVMSKRRTESAPMD
ncbi:unnamed protein product [Calypogeia fissa]